MKLGRGSPPLICETSEVSWPVRKVSAAANSSNATESMPADRRCFSACSRLRRESWLGPS
jgi:hypothetical protein